jgi:hypothetical protein
MDSSVLENGVVRIIIEIKGRWGSDRNGEKTT